MTTLTPTASWDNVPQLDTTTLVLGGNNGPANAQGQALLNRTAYLSNQIASLTSAQNKTISSLAASTGAGLVINPTAGGPYMFAVTLNQPSCAITFLNQAVPPGIYWEFYILLIQGTGANVVTWPSNVLWEYNRTPALSYTAGYADVIKLVSNPVGSSQSWLGFYAGSWFNVQ